MSVLDLPPLYERQICSTIPSWLHYITFVVRQCDSCYLAGLVITLRCDACEPYEMLHAASHKTHSTQEFILEVARVSLAFLSFSFTLRTQETDFSIQPLISRPTKEAGRVTP